MLVPGINKAVFQMQESKLEAQISPLNDLNVTAMKLHFYMPRFLSQNVHFQMQIRQPMFFFFIFLDPRMWVPDHQLELIGAVQLTSAINMVIVFGYNNAGMVQSSKYQLLNSV